jgi:hypothetical protein
VRRVAEDEGVCCCCTGEPCKHALRPSCLLRTYNSVCLLAVAAAAGRQAVAAVLPHLLLPAQAAASAALDSRCCDVSARPWLAGCAAGVVCKLGSALGAPHSLSLPLE